MKKGKIYIWYIKGASDGENSKSDEIIKVLKHYNGKVKARGY